jgi:hypothetical membrane protein
MTKSLLACGVIAGPLFVAVFLVAGATRPGYDPITIAISRLALGEGGWLQTLGFLVSGSLLIAFGVGVWRTAVDHTIVSTLGPSLVWLVGIGLITAGIFPIGNPLHVLASLVALVAMPITCFAFSVSFRRQRSRGWVLYSLATGVFVAALVIGLIPALDSRGPFASVGGLVQRATVVIWFVWVTLLAFDLWRGEGAETRTPASGR